MRFLVAAVSFAFVSAAAHAQAVPPQNQRWKKLEADNGAGYAISLDSIERGSNGAVTAAICTLDNGKCAVWNMKRLLFDCAGHFMDLSHGGGIQMAPSRSVAGQLAAIACGKE